MTREEALQAIKEKMDYYESDKRLRGAIQTLIPELAESEDERIRMELVAFFKGMQDSDWHEKYWHDLEIDRILAYLEKQKEEEGYEAIPVESTLEYKLGFKAGKESEKQKHEWSEDDERVLKGIIGLVDHDQHYGVSNKEMISWLKSLRPSWKPSEEQMKALEAASVRYQSTGLESLYEDLKKVM